MGTQTIIVNYLKEKGYKIEKEFEYNCLVNYQISLVKISTEKSLDNYCSVNIPIPINNRDEDESVLLVTCHDITKNERTTKAYLRDDMLIIAYEFYFTDTENLLANIDIGLDSVVAARGRIRTAQIISKATSDRDLFLTY